MVYVEDEVGLLQEILALSDPQDAATLLKIIIVGDGGSEPQLAGTARHGDLVHDTTLMGGTKDRLASFLPVQKKAIWQLSVD